MMADRGLGSPPGAGYGLTTMDPLIGVRVLLEGSTPVMAAARELLALLGADTIDQPISGSAAPSVGEIDGAIVEGPVPDGLPYPVVRPCSRGDAPAAVERGLPWLSDPPVVPTGEFGPRLVAASAVLRLMAAARGSVVDLDALALLGERAALVELEPAGTSGAGGSATMARARDGWVALNLARPDDVASLPALVGAAVEPADWSAVAEHLAQRTVAELVENAALLGLALAPVGADADAQLAARGQQPVRAPFLVDGARPGRSALRPGASEVVPSPVDQPLVVELASLWAGPLCGRLLADAGCHVVKVEGAKPFFGGGAGMALR